MLLGDLYKSFVGGGKKIGGTKKARKSSNRSGKSRKSSNRSGKSRKSYGPPYFGFK